VRFSYILLNASFIILLVAGVVCCVVAGGTINKNEILLFSLRCYGPTLLCATVLRSYAMHFFISLMISFSAF
jgi:hypothetical protein